jgi:hypothetical protein
VRHASAGRAEHDGQADPLLLISRLADVCPTEALEGVVDERRGVSQGPTTIGSASLRASEILSQGAAIG